MEKARRKRRRIPSDEIITLENVTKSYTTGSPALDGISLHIKKGEFVFIVGDSGSGKSTLIKLLLRELTATEGEITVMGYNLNHIRHRKIPKFRRNLGIVFQDFRLLPDRNVYENVAFAQHIIQKPGSEIRRNVPKILATVGLAGKYKNKVTQLSGGEQQRVALARAILKNAPIVVLDEATAFADPENEALIQKAFAKLTEGRTVIMIAHRLSTVVGADKIIVLEEGRVAEEGTHKELADAGGLYSRMWKDYNRAVKWRISTAEEEK